MGWGNYRIIKFIQIGAFNILVRNKDVKRSIVCKKYPILFLEDGIWAGYTINFPFPNAVLHFLA